MAQKSQNPELEKVFRLEEQLRNSYGQVKPAPEFIESLKHSLITPPRVILENRQKGIVFVIMALGLVGGVILFMIIRAIYRLIANEE
ncbi:MAG: hypothetical protein JEZ00_02655 [Anaerolineaceae bacterium]|nr:hypothetical protein [Anaerolineaceae bacterium]